MLNLSGETGFKPDQLEAGMYHVVSAMNAMIPKAQRVSDELHILQTAAEGAQVGGSDLEDTTYALVSVLNDLHDKGGDAGKVMGDLNSIVGQGDMTMTDLVNALKSGVIPTANSFGVSLQSVGAALDVMGDKGMRGAMAGTRLRMSLALLGAPTEKAAGLLQQIGLSSQQAMSDSAKMSLALQDAGLRTDQLSSDLRKPDGIQVALQDLDSHLRHAGLSATGAASLISAAFGGGRSGATIELLAQSTDRLKTKFDQIGKGARDFGSDWDKTKQTFRMDLDEMVGGVSALGVKLGTDLMPAAEDVLGALKDTANWFARNKVALDALGVAVTTFATVAIGSYLFSKLRAMLSLIKDLGSGISKAYGAIRSTVIEKPIQALTGTTPGEVASPLSQTGVGSVWGARGPEEPGARSYPDHCRAEEFAGGSEGAAGTVATEQHVAQAETGAVEQETGAGSTVAAASGTAAAEAPIAEEGIVGTGMLASLKAGLPDVIGSAMKGGMIAVGGDIAAHLAGSLIGGKAGHVVSSVGGDAAIGAGAGMLFGPEGAAIGGAGGALVGLLSSLGSGTNPLTEFKQQADQLAKEHDVAGLMALADHADARRAARRRAYPVRDDHDKGRQPVHHVR